VNLTTIAVPLRLEGERSTRGPRALSRRSRGCSRTRWARWANAPSCFDADGFFDTGDLVDVDGEWLRFRGRDSEIINVGGNKVYPTETESVLLEMLNVADVTVVGERSPINPHPLDRPVAGLHRPHDPSSTRVVWRRYICPAHPPSRAAKSMNLAGTTS